MIKKVRKNVATEETLDNLFYYLDSTGVLNREKQGGPINMTKVKKKWTKSEEK